MSESLIAYLLYGVLKALEYLHRMGYVHRSVVDRQYYEIHLNYKEIFIKNVKMYVCQGGEGKSYPAVRRGACLPLRAPQCLQYDAWGEEDAGGVWHAAPQPRPAALAQPWTTTTGQASLDSVMPI